MGDLGGNQAPEINSVFVETNLQTRLVVPVVKNEFVSSFKDRFREEHHEHFTEIGEISIDAVKVERGGCLYELSNQMKLRDAFDAFSRNWFLYVDAAKVEKENPLAIVVAHQNCPAEGNQEVGNGIDSAKKTRAGKRKVKSSDGTKSGKKQSAKVDKEDLLATAVADKTTIGKREVEMLSQSANVEKEDHLATVVADKEFGIDSVLGEALETEVAVAETTRTGKRKSKTSDGKKSRKRRVVDESNEVEAVTVAAPISEVLPRKEVDDVLTVALGKENETCEEAVEDATQTDKLASQRENHLEKKSHRKSRKAKSLVKEESVSGLVKNLEPVEAVNGEGADNVIRDVLASLQEKKKNVDKMEKKSKKKHVEKIVEAQAEANSAEPEVALPFENAKDTDALVMSPKDVAGNSEHVQILEGKADMGDALCPSQKDDVTADGGDKRQDHVIDVAQSKEEEKKGLDMHHEGSINSSVSSKKPKEKKARGGSVKPKEKRSSDVTSGAPSNSILDGDESDVNSASRKQENNLSAGAGGARMSLEDVLRRSASYKKAKLSAEQSQAEDKLALG
ncbi:unnamed protein product [Microthlaspi erraticum]|uniref:Uncharacterized protein n=1 Tax=Microthlaspi erraticum TaxID=1685480 RepID=A0A6D2IN49_9BRAS|nr:unnamed protein product [Microthlaspi erraticum]